MNTIELLGEEKTFKDIVEHTITKFEDSEIDTIEGYAFYDCNSLTSVSFPKATSIGSNAFKNCNKLTTIYVGTESKTVCTLKNTNAIPSSVTDIYVPEALVDSYKTASQWSSFASKIKAYTGV